MNQPIQYKEGHTEVYINQPIQCKEGDTEVDNFAQFIRKLLYSYSTCALKNIKPAA